MKKNIPSCAVGEIKEVIGGIVMSKWNCDETKNEDNSIAMLAAPKDNCIEMQRNLILF